MLSADRLIELFSEAKALPADDRNRLVDEACRDDPDLKEQLLILLRAHEQAGDFLQPAPLLPSDAPANEQPGDRIGRYKLLEPIGEGGCGVVYMAEQEEPVRRRVALKVIKLGMDTKSVIARFDAERQALAMMDHPNIAKVLDAGATDAGRPYFVMELVHGVRITDYCDQNNLTTEERLKLFIQVCHAIQHAHQKGIIHRDLKPSNILVTLHDGEPVPKVIDFGVAKATEQRLTDLTVYTQVQQMIGTPLYMSPEQAEMNGLDVDTRTDIYALGVLLYELLTGRTPFDAETLHKSGYDEMRRFIREEEPQKPSTALHTMAEGTLRNVAQHRASEPPKLIHAIRGDLDWIVMKTLEKDRARRYETANGLAADIRRHLENEPVTARPPSRAYQYRKLVRRHRLAFAAGTAIAASLVIGFSSTTWMYFRERDARKRATGAERLATERLAEVSAERDAKEVEREDAEAISTVMREVFHSRDPSRLSGVIPVTDKLAVAAKKLDSDFTDKPARRAKLQAALADIYSALGSHRESVPLREKVLQFHQESAGPDHSATLTAMQSLATAYHDAGRKGEALTLREKVLAVRREKLGPEHRDTLLAMDYLANSYATGRLLDQALELREHLLTLRRRLQGPTHPDTVFAIQTLSSSYDSLGRREEALKLREEVVAIRRKLLSAEHPDTLSAIAILGVSYLQTGSLARATPLLAEVSTRNPGDTVSAITLATVQVWLGQEGEHAATCDRMQKWASDATKPQDVERVAKLSCLRPIDDISRREATLALARKAVKIARGNSGVLPWAHVALGMAEYRCGHYVAADAALTTAVKTAATTGPYRSYTEGTASFYRVMSLSRQGRQAEARELFTAAEAKMKPLPSDETNPMADGKSDHEDLILWLACKEARALLNIPPASKR